MIAGAAIARRAGSSPARVPSHCCYCAFQCGMHVLVDREMRRVVGVEGNVAFPVNRGQMCIKGMTSAEQVNHADRLRYPLVRRGTYVEQGMKVGYVTDYLGKVIYEARATAAGVVLYICAVPSMTKGATIANIGVVAR